MRRPLLLLPLLLACVLAGPVTAGDEVERLERLLEPGATPARVVLGPQGGSSYVILVHGWAVDDEQSEPRDEDGVRRTVPLAELLEHHLPREPSARRASIARLQRDALRRVAVDVEIRDPSGPKRTGRLVTRPGRRAVLEDTEGVRVVTTYSAQLACDNTGGERPSAAGDPVVDTFLEGLAVDVTPFVLDGGRAFAFEALVQAGHFDRPIETRACGARFLGRFDLPVWRGGAAHFTGACRAGEAVQAHIQVGERRLEVRLAPRLLTVGALAPGGALRDLDVDLLLHRFCDMSPERGTGPDPRVQVHTLSPGRPRWLRSEFEDLVAELGGQTFLARLDGGGGWVAAGGGAHDAIRSHVAAHQEAMARTATVEVTLLTGSTVLGRVLLPALAGRTTYGRLGVERAVIPDPDVEVG